MNDVDLANFRKMWHDEWATRTETLGVEQISAVLRKESNNITRQFKVALSLDMVLKVAGAAGLVGLLWLFRHDGVISWMNTSILALTLFLTFLQWMALQSIPPAELAGSSLRHCLQEVVGFYHQRFIRSLYIAAFSGSLIFYVGVLYYAWFKYGVMRNLDTTDLLVFAAGLILAFGLNAVAQRWQAGFQLREVESCLQEIDREELTDREVRQRQFRRSKLRLIWLAWLVLGALVLAWLWWRYHGLG
ncbi:MAG: hypothetical protein PVJ33_05680 [Lysobacterales bacterium]|jgi:hypothetical protein